MFAYTTKLFGAVLSTLSGIVIPLLFALAILFFFWGLVKYIKEDGKEKESGRSIMVWGVVALFVMSSVWGLVKFIQTATATGSSSAPALPSF